MLNPNVVGEAISALNTVALEGRDDPIVHASIHWNIGSTIDRLQELYEAVVAREAESNA